ncbi:MAG: hypothetical protein QM503_05310 [Bacteroidota bacterium]
MKKTIKKLFRLFIALLFMAGTYTLMAQPPPPPGGSSGGGSGTGGTDEQRNGGGAPIGGGLFILLGLGAVYGGRKIYNLKKETLEE